MASLYLTFRVEKKVTKEKITRIQVLKTDTFLFFSCV